MLADLFGVLIQVDADLDGGVGGGVRGVVTSSVWHAEDGDFVPGAELICSDRQFNLWTYSATHSQLLFHSEQMPNGEVRLPTTIEVLFKPIEARVEGASRKRRFWPSTSGVTAAGPRGHLIPLVGPGAPLERWSRAMLGAT